MFDSIDPNEYYADQRWPELKRVTKDGPIAASLAERSCVEMVKPHASAESDRGSSDLERGSA
jgi:hypothetical protein